jgi:hypothetical protein
MPMRYAIVENGKVTNVATSESALEPNWYRSDDAQIGWSFDGVNFAPPPAPVKTPEEVKEEITADVQARLDAFAQSRGYDNIVSACSYATSQHPKYGVEGRYCVQAREDTWDALFAIEAEVVAGTRPLPNGYADIEAELPALVWPV